jgi:hypothetical protein
MAAAFAPAVSAHGGGAARGYASTVTAIAPPTARVSASVLEGDDRLELTVAGDHVVVIEGYEGEPYLRFTPDGVYRNIRSPATYLNDDRYARGRLPEQADAKAAPTWQKVGPMGRAYDWHDHRVHWMSTSYPPVVAADTSKPHHILDWAVPGTIDGRSLEIRGRLDYAPLPGRSFPRVLIVPLLLLAVAAVVLPVRRRRTRLIPPTGTRKDVSA